VVLTIDAAAMPRDGNVFYHGVNGAWLSDTVPVGYLTA
jgi:putative RNA 2'-phosphotransferase